MSSSDTTVPIEVYSRALDEIYALRRALAYEALTIEVHLALKSFPKSRRGVAEEQVDRMRKSARGWVGSTYAGLSPESLKAAFERSGARSTLTRAQWEAENDDG